MQSNLLKLENCVNSAAPRANSELWIEFKKNNDAIVNLYSIENMTNIDYITKQVSALDHVENVNISSDFNELLIVSSKEIDSRKIQDIIVVKFVGTLKTKRDTKTTNNITLIKLRLENKKQELGWLNTKPRSVVKNVQKDILHVCIFIIEIQSISLLKSVMPF